MKTFAKSHFNYCLLACVFHSRETNHRINTIYDRVFSITYQDYKPTFLELLQKVNSVTIHQQNIKVLATRIVMAKTDVSPVFIIEVSELKESSYSSSSQKS